MINSFSTHLESVYELDSFYGDQTRNGLLQDAISCRGQMETFEVNYTLTEAEGDKTDGDKEAKAEETPSP